MSALAALALAALLLFSYVPLAAAAEKPRMLFFRASWCHFCTKMEQRVFRNREILKEIKDSFAAKVVDVDRFPQLRTKYGAEYLPTTLFFTPQGKEVLRLVGYVDPGQFQNAMDYVLGEHYQQGSFQAFEQSRDQ